MYVRDVAPAPCAGGGQGAWCPRRDVLLPRRIVANCEYGVGKMAL